MKIPFIYIDALDESNDEICNQNSVEQLPHVQFLDEKNQVLWEKKSLVSLTDIYQCLRYYAFK